MNQPISSLNLPNNSISKLNSLGYFYCNDVKDNFEVIKSKINIPPWASLTEAPKTKSAQELLCEESKWGFVATFIPQLDLILKTKIIPGSITEVCGFPGTGKTQICLHLSAGVNGEAVYIHTNKNFSSGRLREIAQKHVANGDDVLERLLCIEATDPVELVASVHFLQNWLSSHTIRLLIIDSISWPLRQQTSTERTTLIYRIFQDLRILANSHKFAIIMTNDLTTRVAGPKTYHTSAFGDSFYHIINNRVLLSKEGSIFSAKILKSVVSSSRESEETVPFKF